MFWRQYRLLGRLIRWDDYYGLDDGQMNLVESLFERKIKKAETDIYLNAEEAKNLHGEIEECVESLRELNIFLPVDCYKG